LDERPALKTCNKHTPSAIVAESTKIVAESTNLGSSGTPDIVVWGGFSYLCKHISTKTL
jgi:hypothetical protein